MTGQGNHIENDLLIRVAKGEDAAFRYLYDQYHKQIYNQALSYLRLPELASDAVQNVFTKIWSSRHKLPEVKDLNSYLFIVARNVIITDLRKKIAHVYLDEEITMLEEDTRLPDRQLSLKEAMEIVHEAIDQLPPQQKKAYTLSKTYGMKTEEIAREMKLSPQTVKTHIKQALKTLRKYLSDRSVDLALLIVFLIQSR